MAVSALTGVLFGSTRVSVFDFWQALTGGTDTNAAARIFWYVRFPRTLACMVCGGALAVSGAVIQCVLANDLASPGIIGVNSGAGLAVTACVAFGVYGGWQLSFFAFIGAVAAVFTVSAAAGKLGASKSAVILTGVAINSLLNALADTVVIFSPDTASLSSDFKIGDFSSVTYGKLVPAAAAVAVALLILLTLTNELDILTLGEETARGLGLNTEMMRALFLIIAALLAGCAVSIAGLLSFVGLIVPHAVKRISGTAKSAHIIPLCALFGGGFVTLCDTFARTVFAPYEIPAGIIMAFLGVPFFIFILFKRKGGHSR